MKATSYRLAHYKLLENIDGSLWWESYAGFARTQSGKCFIESNILFLEPAIVVSEPGFLIMEYKETLEKMPHWTKTPYYCTHYTLRFCPDDKILSIERINKGLRERTEEKTIDPAGEKIGYVVDKTIGSFEVKSISYQLGRYEIIEAENEGFQWNTCTHLNRLKVGRGVIEGKILFINGKTIEESEFSKREFYNRLNRLPKWKKTPFYCTNYNLKPCQKTEASILKQSARNPKVPYEHQITDRKTHSRSIAGLRTVIAIYKNRFFKRIKK